MKYKRQSAFTLIELILVILILGIMSVTVLPKMFGSSSVEHFTVRDQFIGQLRLVQLQAMNQLERCNRLIITSSYFGVEANNSASCGTLPLADNRVALNGVSIKNAADASVVTITFNHQGIATDCGECTFNIIGEATVQVKIESQGYIHGL
ncbi:MAG: prepilin-type N-terminal cleavage/methylation domain-containing protein [Psychrobium sp.]|nr:prepilin-type N-terminal cleavage/methylation domain-containing protein [Psychrobium sp.]